MKKTKKAGFLLINGETWPYDVVVGLGVDRDQFKDYLKRRFVNPLTKDDDEKLFCKGHGLTLRLENKSFVLWLKKFPNTPDGFGFLAHEIFHTADLMLRSAGMELSSDSDEAWAYQIGWLTNIIYRKFKL